MEGLEIDLLIGNEDVAVYMIERQDSACEYAGFLKHGFLGYAFNFAHIERFLVELLDDHTVDALLHIVVVLLLVAFEEEDDPLLKILHVFVGRKDGWVTMDVLIRSERSSYILKGSGGLLPMTLMVQILLILNLNESASS